MKKRNKAEQLEAFIEENNQEITDKKRKENFLKGYLDGAKAFESDKLRLQKKLTKLSFILCGVFAVVAIVAVLASSYVLKMKKVEAFVIRVDNSTGFADIVNVASDNEESYGATLDKYWLSQYVVNRESYNWESIQNMADTVALMSTSQISNEYMKYMRDDKKGSPMYLLKDKMIIVTQIKSVSFIETTGANLAQVRFVRFVKNVDGTIATEFAPTSWIATITYDFKKSLNTEGERRINPLGFQVTSYRVNNEKVAQQ